MSRILIVEDEEYISEFVAKGLTNVGYACRVAETAKQAFELATSEEFDLIVLDIGLPDEDGFSLLRRMRRSKVTAAVIILTARNSVTDTVAGLEGGADDYMPKPFKFEELLARVRLRLRSAHAGELTVLQPGGHSLDQHTPIATGSSGEVELSAREFALVETFLRNPRRVFTREQLLARVWNYDFDPGSNVVDVYMGYLRKKLGAEHFVTVRGVGYSLARGVAG